MNLSDLERSGDIEKTGKDPKTAANLFKTAENDIKTAGEVSTLKRYNWAVAIAYQGMLNAGRALMFAKGWRTRSETHHVAVVRFCAAALPSGSLALVNIFNRYRVRRHDLVYGDAEDSVSESEAERVIENAKIFLEAIEKMLK